MKTSVFLPLSRQELAHFPSFGKLSMSSLESGKYISPSFPHCEEKASCAYYNSCVNQFRGAGVGRVPLPF